MAKIERATKTENNSDNISSVSSSDWELFNPDESIVSSRINPSRKTDTIIVNNLNNGFILFPPGLPVFYPYNPDFCS